MLLLSASAQDALYSSVSLDELTAAQASQPPGQRYLGPVAYSLGAYAGVSYDDNANGSQNAPESDIISRVGGNLSLDWAATDHSDLQVGAGIGYRDYQRFSGNNGLEINPDSALTYAISLDDVILTLFDQLSYSREVRTEAALANVVTLPQLNNDVGIRAEWDPGHWMLQATYSHNDFVSNHDNDFLNRSSEYFFAHAGWRFAEATQVGLEASDGLTHYQVSPLNDNQSLSVGGFVEWQVRPSVQFTLRGGPVFYEPNQPVATGGGSTINTYYVSLEASYQMTDFLSHELTINRSLQAGLNQGGGYIEQLAVNYSITWKLTQWIKAGVSASYVDGTQPLVELVQLFPNFEVPVSATEKYRQYGAGLQLSWDCTDHLSMSLGFSHWLRDSNLPDRGYTDNSVSCQLNYSF